MQELLLLTGFAIIICVVGVILSRKQGLSPLRTSKTVSNVDIDIIMRKRPEERTLADAIALKIYETQSKSEKF